MTRHAIVVGGGIGGLATALALHRIGWRTTVLERAPELARYDDERRPRDQAAARGARTDGAMSNSRLGQPAITAMVRLMPSALWRKGLAPDGNPTWRWRPPKLPVERTS